MSNFTKKAIKASFLKLLEDRPLSAISVRDIVEDCGINRNSFYYHFQDMPSLIEEIVTDCFDELIKSHPETESLSAGLDAAFRFTLENKKAILHVYGSVRWDVFGRYFMRFFDHLINAFLSNAKECSEMTNDEKLLLAKFLKCELYGIYIDWLEKGMTEAGLSEAGKLFKMCDCLVKGTAYRREKSNDKT